MPYTRSGNTLYISGQVTVWNGERKFVGKVGQDFTVEQGKDAARLCALNILAQAKAAGWTFFIFALSYYGRKGVDAPGTSNLWDEYQAWRKSKGLAAMPSR